MLGCNDGPDLTIFTGGQLSFPLRVYDAGYPSFEDQEFFLLQMDIQTDVLVPPGDQHGTLTAAQNWSTHFMLPSPVLNKSGAEQRLMKLHSEAPNSSATAGFFSPGDAGVNGSLGSKNQKIGNETNRWSMRNAMVFIPIGILLVPIIWISIQANYLDQLPNVPKVWTAPDSDVREVEISDLGASGIALLRFHDHRKFGIYFANVGLVVQAVFVYFIFLAYASAFEIRVEQYTYDAPLILLFVSCFFNALLMCAHFIQGKKLLKTTTPEGYENVHRLLVIIDSFILPVAAFVSGQMWISTSSSTSQYVFNCTSVAWVMQINRQIAKLMTWNLASHGGYSIKPNWVSVKDTDNNMELALYSLLASAILSAIFAPVAIYVMHE